MLHPSRLLAYLLVLMTAALAPGSLAFVSSPASSAAHSMPMAGCHNPHSVSSTPVAPTPAQDQHRCCTSSHQRAIVVAGEVVTAPTVVALTGSFDGVERMLNFDHSRDTADFSSSPPPIFSLRI